jgi:hypothetical protein
VAVRLARGTLTRICDHGERFVVQIINPLPLGAAIAGMRLARSDLLRLAAPGGPAARAPASAEPDEEDGGDQPGRPGPSISQVVATPTGPLVLVEGLDAPYEVLRTIPAMVMARLDESGVIDGLLASPEPGGALDRLDATPNAVVLRLFPTPAGADGVVPARWLDVASEWVLGDLPDEEIVRVRILGVESEVSVAHASAVLHECRITRAWCDIVSGSLTDRLRTASLTFGRVPHVALGAGGPGTDRNGIVLRFGVLQEVARELAPEVAYACIDMEATFEGLALGLNPDGWRRQGGAPPNLVAGELVDELVPDAFPYQILGLRHTAKLEGLGGLVPLRDGKMELTLGEPADWLPSAPVRFEAQATGWDLLRPCLATDDEIYQLLRSRPRPGRVGAGGDANALPDFESIVLEAQPHPHRGTRLTLLELVSWINHEPHTDAPQSVSPVLATFLRWWSAGVDASFLDRLKTRAVAIAAAPSGPELDSTRRWAATDWLVRVQAAAWLRLAGFEDVADRLGALGALSDNLELIRAVDVLGSAITTAARRIDIAAALANDDPGAEQLAWDAWEDVNEVSAWVAASEAATEGAPTELTYATDLRVIECSRDARARDEIEAARVTVGDSTWATALHAVAEEAWERGWRAADAGSRELSGMKVRDEMRRAAAALAGGGDAHELDTETAETAARDELTRAALRNGAPGEDGKHPWDAARLAAESSEGGRTWIALLDEARAAVGEDAWAQGMADARAATDTVLRDAPDVVARIVAAAVAREASSAAARSVAYREIAFTLANGGSEQAAADAAHDALGGVAGRLRDVALELVDRLIDPRPRPPREETAAPPARAQAPRSNVG